MIIPNGVVIDSDDGIEKLATKSLDNAPEITQYADAAEILLTRASMDMNNTKLDNWY